VPPGSGALPAPRLASARNTPRVSSSPIRSKHGQRSQRPQQFAIRDERRRFVQQHVQPAPRLQRQVPSPRLAQRRERQFAQFLQFSGGLLAHGKARTVQVAEQSVSRRASTGGTGRRRCCKSGTDCPGAALSLANGSVSAGGVAGQGPPHSFSRAQA